MDTFYLEKLYDIFKIPFFLYQKGTESFQLPDAAVCQSPLSKDAALLEELIEAAKKQTSPFIYLEDDIVYYGIFRDEEERYFLFGPLARMTMKLSRMEAYRHSHRITSKFHIQKAGLGNTSKVLALAFYQQTGNKINHQDLPLVSRNDEITKWTPESDVESYQLTQSEQEREHNSIEYENMILQLVKNGDVAAVKELMSADALDMDSIGMVAESNKKQMEYLTVAFLTLISRAAIEGGMNPEKSYELSDVYLQKLEKCKNVDEMVLVGAKAQFDFTEKVRQAKEQRSKLVYIDECKDYIAKHLRKPFMVGDIALAIGVNRTYLARKFSEIEGITIQQYIMQERCRHAANLLKYSKYPISIISEYFCFSSQSHFGKQFKQMYGMTPNEYRSSNRYIKSNKEEF